MALFGLFGRKGDSKPQEETGSGFYLEGNAAQGLGDMDRFKDLPPVKKTFPVEVEAPKSTTPKAQVSFNPVAEESSSKTERRRADSSMDMYRNLAKEIKKP